MDKKSKIIVVIGTIIFLICFSGFIWFMFIRTSPTENKEDEILIDMPKVDENKIPKNSKYDNYEQANKGANKQQNTKYDLFNFGDDNHKKTEDSLSLADDELGFEKRYMMLAKQDSINKGIKSKELLQRRNDEAQMSEELKELMDLQNQLAVQNNELDNTADIQAMLNEYNKAVLAASSNGANMNTGVDSLVHEANSIHKGGEDEDPNFDIGTMGNQNYFHGVGSFSNSKVQELIPVETVDEEVLVNGSTIALRTKMDIKLIDPSINIAKGAIIYGKVNISTDRLMINIESYKEGLKLYMLNFVVYDFDGRKGVHLGNNTWPKIPSRVAKDVYDYAYQRGTQAAAFGGNTEINLSQAKDIAILSATKNVGSEVFDKRKVFMPKKYHLWFNIATR